MTKILRKKLFWSRNTNLKDRSLSDKTSKVIFKTIFKKRTEKYTFFHSFIESNVIHRYNETKRKSQIKEIKLQNESQLFKSIEKNVDFYCNSN